jgi:hypothetical protein
MAKYQITIEFTTQLSREVEANSSDEAERLADSMYQEYERGEKAHIVGTGHHRSVELLSQAATGRFAPIGE